ncbi:pyridoxamine 5'-phosphate oxidase family protein [Falsirhodobacter sp. 20TX0035]|uniref:pyridoxamine 5'-phosphate oxidase family protein n=1 Tax=Falsirhodobacter sp. 20TX0035 TaxID=3022019 RepID=UPI00232BFCAC|nr:pyridoxamine 5'-phosphate oxidase family protein [Falsirhodobacter sp. 20TX0035]MDB6452452.1 pyridoxamine 5'-phosphate oxidase family protein [Falsirhodobacter sp. 20TX0035]
MTPIATLDDLHALYGRPGEAARTKVTDHLTPAYAAFIQRSRFCVLTTVGPEGTDGSPRGDDGPVVRILDERTMAMPDWKGNDRIDSLRNIVRDGRCSLMFLVHGSNNAMRVNATAKLTADDALRASFARGELLPRSVILFRVGEVYSQCARALLRSGLWSRGPDAEGLPTVGDMLREVTGGTFDGQTYDREWAARAARTMW